MIPLCHSTLSRCTNTIVPNSRDAKQNYLLSFLIKRNQVQCVSNNYFLSHAWLSGIVEKRRGSSRDAKQNYLLSFLIKRNQVQCVSNNYVLSHAWLSGIVEKRRGFRTPRPLFLWGLEDRWVNIEGSKLKEQSCQSSHNNRWRSV